MFTVDVKQQYTKYNNSIPPSVLLYSFRFALYIALAKAMREKPVHSVHGGREFEIFLSGC